MSSPQNQARAIKPPGLSGWRRATESLSSKAFRGVFISNMAFFLAMGAQGIVRPWLAFQLTESALDLGFVSAATALPMLLLAPFGGVLADRVERRRLILTAQAGAVIAESGILVLLLTDRLEFWHLVACAGLMGCAFPLIMPARQAIVNNIVGKKGLGSAMALNMAGVNVTRVVGPAMAGLMIPIVSVEGVYAGSISLYLMALFAMSRVSRVPPPADAKDASILRNLADGIRYVRSNRLILTLLLYGLVPMFLAMPFQTLLVVFAEQVWETGSTGLGILNAASGIGAVVGSVYVAARHVDAGRVRVMMLSVVAFGSLLAIFAICPWFLPAVGLVFAANIFASVFGTLNNTAIQLLIPDQVRGRISAFLMMSFSLPLLGTLPVAALAERIGAQAAVGIASGLAVVAAIAFYLGSKDLRNLDIHVKQASVLD